MAFDDVTSAMAADAQSGAPDMLDDVQPMTRAGFAAHNVTAFRRNAVNIHNHSGDAFVLHNAS